MAAAGFQTSVNLYQAPAMAGDFSTANPRSSVEASQGTYVAGVGGLNIGLFCWADVTDAYLTNAGTGAPTGFIHREQGLALITQYLAQTGTNIPAGFQVTAMKSGGYWVQNVGAGAVTKGQKVFASNTTGAVQTAAAGATVAGYTETKWYAMNACLAGELFKMSDIPLG